MPRSSRANALKLRQIELLDECLQLAIGRHLGVFQPGNRLRLVQHFEVLDDVVLGGAHFFNDEDLKVFLEGICEAFTQKRLAVLAVHDALLDSGPAVLAALGSFFSILGLLVAHNVLGLDIQI